MNARGASGVAALLAASLAIICAGGPGDASARASNPETDARLGPADGAGRFLGYPSPTYSWHGCTKADTHFWPVSLVTGEPTPTRGTSRYVRLAFNRTGYPSFTWKVKPGYRICGVQAAVQLTSPQVRGSDLLAEVSYKSGATAGATATSGRETLKVRIPTKGIAVRGFEEFEGRTFSIFAFQSVTVFVKNK